jgi:hypothetical protein
MHFLATNGMSIVALFGVTGWMLKMWLGHQEKMKGLSMSTQGTSATDRRLARVEQAVEAVAIEIERISEGQRFVTKLLADRAPVTDAMSPSARRSDAH